MAGETAEVGERKFVRLPTFLERGFLDLKYAVIAQRICCLCGTCAAFCEKIAIMPEVQERAPRFTAEYDTVCGLCYTFCPRTFLSLGGIERKIFGDDGARAKDEVLGFYRGAYAVRSTRADILSVAQDGGAVTSLLVYARDEGLIDCAVITTSDTAWRPSVKVARSYEDLKLGAGTKYTLYPSVLGIREAITAGCEAIGFVGLPCQIQGVRKVQTAEQPYDVGITKVKLLIGLFCMENFTEALLEFVGTRCAGGTLDGVRKFEIRDKDLLIHEKEERRIPLDELKSYVGAGCLVCMDYTAELADISVGSVGSEQGWSTVFTRTALGEEVVRAAEEKGYIELRDLEKAGLDSIRRLSRRKKKKGGSERRD